MNIYAMSILKRFLWQKFSKASMEEVYVNEVAKIQKHSTQDQRLKLFNMLLC